MQLLLSIGCGLILGWVLWMFEMPGLVLGFGIVAGCLFRILFLLIDIRARLPVAQAKPVKHTKAEDAVTAYLQDRDKR